MLHTYVPTITRLKFKMQHFSKFLLIFVSVACLCKNQVVAQCGDDSECTNLCGRAGAGTCVNGTHCVCETCPQRSTEEVSAEYKLKVCSPTPGCDSHCPESSFSLTTGKFYSGHICSIIDDPTTFTCICFCMPTTLESVLTVIECPALLKPNSTDPPQGNNSNINGGGLFGFKF